MSKIGRYEIIRKLGSGGMATVYLAHDPATDRDVAIKVLPEQFVSDPQLHGRFHLEARIMANLNHPCIVPVFDYGEDGDQPFIVMPYMAGGTLADRILQLGRPFTLAEVMPILRRLCEALEEAHNQKIVHRDVKPGNVLFDLRGNAYLSDFGIIKLKLLENSSDLATYGFIGTKEYASPEQWMLDKTIDARSDIYSLAVLVYELLDGHRPYTPDEIGQRIGKTPDAPPPLLKTDKLNLPSAINQVMERALATLPEKRYRTITELLIAMMNLQLKPLPPPPPPLSTLRLIAFLTVPFIVLGISGFWIINNLLPTKTPTPTHTLTATSALTLTTRQTQTPGLLIITVTKQLKTSTATVSLTSATLAIQPNVESLTVTATLPPTPTPTSTTTQRLATFTPVPPTRTFTSPTRTVSPTPSETIIPPAPTNEQPVALTPTLPPVETPTLPPP